MQRSTDRLLTTHIGSLPRPDHLRESLLARDQGQAYDEAALQSSVRSAVTEAVRRQVAVGLDVVADGEMGKNSGRARHTAAERRPHRLAAPRRTEQGYR
jgi:5-methyltetrahydropteroyltriglutamate--homocysteine methyltransferase